MSYYSSGYGQPQPSSSSSAQLDPSLAFYSGGGQPSFYSEQPALAAHGARSDISGAIGGGAGGAGGGAAGGAGAAGAAFGGQIVVQNWWNAFTPWTGMEGEPPLLEGALHLSLLPPPLLLLVLLGSSLADIESPPRAELGINFDHILQKSLTVLNPLRSVDPHIMDDADLAGPLVFCFVFASFLLLVRPRPLSPFL